MCNTPGGVAGVVIAVEVRIPLHTRRALAAHGSPRLVLRPPRVRSSGAVGSDPGARPSGSGALVIYHLPWEALPDLGRTDPVSALFPPFHPLRGQVFSSRGR